MNSTSFIGLSVTRHKALLGYYIPATFESTASKAMLQHSTFVFIASEMT